MEHGESTLVHCHRAQLSLIANETISIVRFEETEPIALNGLVHLHLQFVDSIGGRGV